MTAKKRVVRRKKTLDVPTVVREYLLNRGMRERSDAYEKKLRGEMMEYMEDQGDISLEEPMDFVSYSKGKPKERSIAGLARVVRRSKFLNSERAEEFLRERGLWEDCVVTEVTLSEEKVIRQNFIGEITEDELAALYDERAIPAIELVDE